MVYMWCTTLFLTFAVFFNAVIVDSYDTVPITGSRVCKMYNRGRSLRETLTFTWKGLKLNAGCRLDFRDSKHNQICVDIDAKLSCSSAPLSVIQNTHLESITHYLDCTMKTRRWCSNSRLTVIFKPSLYSNYKNDVTVKFYPADENGKEYQVVPFYPVLNNEDGDYIVEQTEAIHDTAMSITVTIGIIIALIVGGIIVITLIICCCCCKSGRSQGHVYRPTTVTTTTTTVVNRPQNYPPPQYPAQAPGGYPGYQSTSPAPPAAQMAPPHQGTSPGYPPQNMPSGYPLQNQDSKPEPSAPPAPSAPYMQDMPYYPPPQDHSYPPPPGQSYPGPQPYGGMVQPPPYSEK